jgi:ubiquinone/menaquinone biosynthesis C-methylase UbiE
MSSLTPTRGVYQHGHHASVVASHAKRCAEVEAAFLLPCLRPGLRLLDVGCGPGSITVGLAQRVAPAGAVGVDPSSSVIATARAFLAERPLSNLSFEVGNIYQHRFDEASFDVIFAHQVLQHLTDPVGALQHMRKLLAPGGLVAARDVDWGSTAFFPDNKGMRQFLHLYYRLAERNGGQANAGRSMPHWFREAGLQINSVTTSTEQYVSGAAQAWAESWAKRILGSNIAEKSLEYGFANPSDLGARCQEATYIEPKRHSL